MTRASVVVMLQYVGNPSAFLQKIVDLEMFFFNDCFIHNV